MEKPSYAAIVCRLRRENPNADWDEIEEWADEAYEELIEQWRQWNNQGIAAARGWSSKKGGKGWWG